jgi:cation:H+ antiporter
MIAIIALWFLLLVVSLVVLVKSSDWFITAAEKIGLHHGIPAFIIGMTIVAFGTSFPELVSSVFSVVKGHSEIVFGTVIGSNISNILLVFGVLAATTKSFKIEKENFKLEMYTLIGITAFSMFLLYKGVTIIEAILLIALLIFYVIASVRRHTTDKPEKVKMSAKVYLMCIIGIAGTLLAANFTVESVIKLSELFSINSGILAATIIALGTSLPEVMVSITAISRKQASIAVGNIVGSNIFNFLAVVGISRLFGPVGSVAFWTLVPILVLVTLVFFLMTLNRRVKQWYGVTLIAIYGIYFVAAFL